MYSTRTHTAGHGGGRRPICCIEQLGHFPALALLVLS